MTQENVNATKIKICEGILIRLTDSSDAGWPVVDEYVANPLAEESDDGKKMTGGYKGPIFNEILKTINKNIICFI